MVAPRFFDVIAGATQLGTNELSDITDFNVGSGARLGQWGFGFHAVRMNDKPLIVLCGYEIFVGHGKLAIGELVSLRPHLMRGQSTGLDAGI